MYYIHTPANADPVYPFTLTDLRRAYPNVSWPEVIDQETAASFHCHAVLPTDEPKAPGQKAVRIAPEQVGGAWQERWELIAYSEAEIAAQWSLIRQQRKDRLAACDWTQLPDSPLSNVAAAAWAEYRQALRDITDQADPFAIEWPVAPQ